MVSARRDPLRVALVGTGGVCTGFHIPALKSVGAHVVAAVDPNPKSLAQAGRLLPGATLLRSLADFPEGIDCAVVSSPTALHARQAIELLERGVDVLCEKPLARTSSEAEEVVRTATDHHRVLQVGYTRRFHPAAEHVRETLAKGDRGAPLGCLMLAGHVWGSGELSPSTMNKDLSGGGVLVDIGVHLVDRACSWFGDLSLVEYLDDNAGGMEANAVVRLAGKVGGVRVPVTILLSRTRELGFRSSVGFAAGSLVSDLNRGHSVTWVDSVPGSSGLRSEVVNLAPPQEAVGYFAAQWQEFASRTQGGEERLSSLRDAVHVTQLVEQCYARRQPLSLPWEEMPEALGA